MADLHNQKQLLCDSSSTADWANWGQGIEQFLTTGGSGSTLGMTATADRSTQLWGTAPTAGNSYYAVYESNDGLTPYWIEIAYGAAATHSCPTIAIQLSTVASSSGAWGGGGAQAPTAAFSSPFVCTGITSGTVTNPTTAYYECDFGGVVGGSAVSMLMWRNVAGGAYFPVFIGWERSMNAAGAYTSGYVTLLVAGATATSTAVLRQQSLNLSPALTGLVVPNWSVPWSGTLTSLNINGSAPFLPVVPLVGVADNYMTIAGVTMKADTTEGQACTATLSSGSMNYISSQTTNFTAMPGFTTTASLLARYQ